MVHNAGEFFLAHLIESQNASNRAIVAAMADRAVGFMSLTDDCDVKLLKECFELAPYDHLMKTGDCFCHTSCDCIHMQTQTQTKTQIHRYKHTHTYKPV